MVTQEEAEDLAGTFLQEYIKSCRCDSRKDVANAMLKMALFCGTGMCAVVGYDVGVELIKAVAMYTAESEKDAVYKSEPMH